MVRVTFTFDEYTVKSLRQAASRLNKPQSAVVREAIQAYADRIGRLSDEERRRMLKVLDRMIARPPARGQGKVDAEIAAIRLARKTGGRRIRPA
jgi:hypothetical protein